MDGERHRDALVFASVRPRGVYCQRNRRQRPWIRGRKAVAEDRVCGAVGRAGRASDASLVDGKHRRNLRGDVLMSGYTGVYSGGGLGPQGPAGSAGSSGMTGPTGAPGADGAQGAAGPTGSAGPNRPLKYVETAVDGATYDNGDGEVALVTGSITTDAATGLIAITTTLHLSVSTQSAEMRVSVDGGAYSDESVGPNFWSQAIGDDFFTTGAWAVVCAANTTYTFSVYATAGAIGSVTLLRGSAMLIQQVPASQ